MNVLLSQAPTQVPGPVGEPPPAAPAYRSAKHYLADLARRGAGPILRSALLGSACAAAQACVPVAVGRAIDRGVIPRDRHDLLLWAGVVLLLSVAQAAAGILADRAGLAASLGGVFRTVKAVTLQTCRLGSALPRRVSVGEAVSVGVTDTRQIGAALESVGRGAGALTLVSCVCGIMLSASWQLSLLVVVGVPVMAWLVGRVLRPLHGRQEELRDQQSHLTEQAADMVTGLRVLRGLGGEAMFGARYGRASQEVRAGAVRVARVESALQAVKLLLPGLLLTAVVAVGSRQVLDGRISVGQLVVFLSYATLLTGPLHRLTDTADQITRALVSAGRVVRFLSAEPAEPPMSPESPGQSPAPAESPAVTAGPVIEPPAADAGADPVADPAVLTDPLSGLTAAPGRFLAVVCATPQEAATLARRLGGHPETPDAPDTSDVLDAAAPPASGPPPPDTPRPAASSDRRILVADNEARFFTGPLRWELTPARVPELPADRLAEALHTACAGDVVQALPDGLDTTVSGSGHEFSGGQLQRLRLARALLADPEVLVLVDPTSALDAHTEGRVARRLAEARPGRTTLVLTTSAVVLDQAGGVVFVSGGRVAGTGSHRTLLADPAYRAIVELEETA